MVHSPQSYRIMTRCPALARVGSIFQTACRKGSSGTFFVKTWSPGREEQGTGKMGSVSAALSRTATDIVLDAAAPIIAEIERMIVRLPKDADHEAARIALSRHLNEVWPELREWHRGYVFLKAKEIEAEEP